MSHAGYMLSNGERVAATAWGLFVGQFMMWTYLALWLRFYRDCYIAKGGRKYNQHRSAQKTGNIKSQ